MALRNTLLIAALVAGVAIIVFMYVRRGMSDLQGQIDDIETVLAAMPPELTSGQLASLPPGWSQPQPHPSQLTGGAQLQPAMPTPPLAEPVSVPVQEEGGAWVPDEALEAGEPGIGPADGLPEYSLDDEFGIATLSEPGVYESGVVQLTVHPAGSELSGNEIEVIDLAASGAGEAVESPATTITDADLEAETEVGEEAEAEVVRDDDAEDDRAASPEPPESPPVGDEFDRLTLPELKARLKATQPGMTGIARMKRAEVLDRLRSIPEEAAN